MGKNGHSEGSTEGGSPGLREGKNRRRRGKKISSQKESISPKRRRYRKNYAMLPYEGYEQGSHQNRSGGRFLIFCGGRDA